MASTHQRIPSAFSTQGQALRVAMVTETFPPEINGVAMTIGRMVNGLLARGHSVQLIRPRQNNDNQSASSPQFEEALTTGIPIPRYQDLKFGLISSRRLLGMWEEKRPDLVHVVTEGPLGWSAVRAARKLNLPLTSGFHTNFHSYSSYYGIGLLHKPIAQYLRMLHNHTDATLVPTKALADELGANGYQNLVVISRGVDCALFHPSRRNERLRALWGAGANDLVLLYVGRLAEEKNVLLVVESFQAIRQELPSTRLVFVGNGPQRDALQASCPDAVFAGMRTGEDLAAHYASADIFLFPSVTETYGNVTPEALASGLAVVAFDHAAAADLIQDGSNGRTVPLQKNTAFSEAAVLLARDRLLRDRLSRAAPTSVAHLHWDRVCDHFSDTLGATIARHNRSPSSGKCRSR